VPAEHNLARGKILIYELLTIYIIKVHAVKNPRGRGNDQFDPPARVLGDERTYNTHNNIIPRYM